MDTTNMPVENAKNREAGSEESPEISRDETGVKTLSLKQKILSRNVVLSILFLISYIGLYFLMFNPNVCVMIEPLDAKTARITKYLYLGLSLVILLLFFFVFKRDVWEKFTITASKPVAIITGVITIGFMDVLFTINSQEALRRGIYTLISAFAIFVICYCIIKAGISIILSFWHDLDKKEKMLFAGICGFGFLLCFILYLITSFFSYPTAANDVLFDFDNQFNYVNNYFLNIFKGENDMRHFLITLSTMPFAIFPYMISMVVQFIPGIYGLLITFEQVVIVAYVILLLIKFLKIENFYVKIAFAAMVLCTSLCFIDMVLIEKFIFGLFYIFLTLSLTAKHSKWKWLAFVFAVGSLTPCAALGPVVLFYDRKPIKEYVKETLGFVCLFLIVLCVSGQLNPFVFMGRGYEWVMSYSAYEKSNLKIKFMQTVIFIANLFLIPQMKINGNIRQMSPEVDGLFWVGLIIIGVSLVSIILNRKDKFTWICAYWQLCIFVMIFVVGYGTASNATFIYSAMFAWSSFALVFKFFDTLIKNKKILVGVLAAICFAMLVYNSIQMATIVGFVKGSFQSIFTFLFI